MFVASCDSWPGLSDAGSGLSGGGRVEQNDGALGSSCSSTGVQCNSGLTCVSSAPSGLCTKVCTSDSDCSAYSAKCTLAFGGMYCIKTCLSDQMCREGYSCLNSICLQGVNTGG